MELAVKVLPIKYGNFDYHQVKKEFRYSIKEMIAIEQGRLLLVLNER